MFVITTRMFDAKIVPIRLLVGEQSSQNKKLNLEFLLKLESLSGENANTNML